MSVISNPSVLYEDNHLLVVNKPAGLVTQGAAANEVGLVDWARTYLKEKFNKPGNVYIGIVSRLDAAVTGVIVLARTSKAASRLSEQFRAGTVEKRYWALVEGAPSPPSALCSDLLRKDQRQHKMYVTQQSHTEAKEARLRYSTLKRLGKASLVEIQLETGRKHQIRVQLASRGHPILGDTKYGATAAFPAGIALHARTLTITHPVQKTRKTFIADLPGSWRQYGVAEDELA